jgi:pilus assembly protein CpaE
MSNTLQVLCICREADLAGEVVAAMGTLPGFTINARQSDYGAASSAVQEKVPDLVVVILPGDVSPGITMIEDIRRLAGGAHIVALAPDEMPETIIRTMRAGADEVLPMPVSTTALLKVCIKVTEVRKSNVPAAGPQGALWVVHAPKGGVGATTVAANLAVALRTRERSCSILDLDMHQGDLALYLNVTPTYTLLDIVEDVKRLDQLFLQGTMTRHESGVEVLAAPVSPNGLSPLDLHEEDAGTILDLLSRLHEITIVDTPSVVTAAVRAAAMRADRFFLVTDLTLPSVRACLRCLEWLRLDNVDLARIELIINKQTKVAGELPPEEVSKALKLPVRALLPRDDNALTALNHGQTLRDVKQNLPVWNAILALTAREGEDTGEKKRGSLMRLFGSRTKKG